jgi:hypothetical protein
MAKEVIYALYIGKSGEYNRDFGNGKNITLKNKIAAPVRGEVIGILKDAKDVVLFNGISNSVISFEKEEV